MTPAIGCTLVDSGETLSITAHTGESVLLPCSCTDLNSTPDTFTWRKLRKNRQAWYKISSESDQYRNRVQLFNNLSPANLSLLISHLTEEDAGEYRCYVKQSEYINIRVTAEGVPTKTKQPSTVIPRPTSPSTSITPSPQSPTAEHTTMAPAIGVPTKTKQPSRVIPRPTSPSTSITPSPQSPTAEHTTMTPAIGSPQSFPFVPFALATVIFLHIIVAVVYCTKRTKAQSDPARVHYSTADGEGMVSLE
ncbi:uncharacterized protein LOC111197520 [Astyanax mexicanus]|uniref:uncharacterized protein LOC111197520 n=1 Tax=Astyanax mexicanus TaxID=7994 RepID=UPI0020CAFB50|nr:uncharacterized protein LOC111197520 [Astyanax mexicanus]